MSARSSIKLATVAALVCLAMACHKREVPTNISGVEPSGEPEQYSAIIVRSVDDGVEREISVSRIVKAGDLRREEWTEQGASRAQIWRLDLGKTYLLDLDQRRYVETAINPNEHPQTLTQSTASRGLTFKEDPGTGDYEPISGQAVDGEAIERAFGDAPSPSRVETRRLADRTIDGHPCMVTEQLAVFDDARVEVTTTFRASDLSGLAIRVETGLINNRVKLITSWRDIHKDAPVDAFYIPVDFKRVDRLSR